MGQSRILIVPSTCSIFYSFYAKFRLEQFVEKVFEPYGLDWKKYIQVDKSFFRPLDIHISKANPSKAKAQLGWQAKTTLDKVIAKMSAGSVF